MTAPFVSPGALVIAIGIWWTANTVAHIAIHQPFFSGRAANAWMAAGLTAVLGFPQSLWRDRHLAHHAGRPPRVRLSRELVLQGAIVGALWTVLGTQTPMFFATVYMPGYVGGLLLCAVHGHYEHAGGTTSHYGRLYNVLCFNDGYHAEHHRQPSRSWADLPACRESSARTSAWPAPLRWIDALTLEALERIVLRSAMLQRVVLGLHARALEPLIAFVPSAPRVAIVGGGLFPRTALILRGLLPSARIAILDASWPNLVRAAALLRDADVTLLHARATLQGSHLNVQLEPGGGDSASDIREAPWDVVVFPLSFDGDRAAIYSRPPAPVVIVHDWIWYRRGTSRIVSLALLKRVNLVRRAPATSSETAADTTYEATCA